jgi:hypothetical protein
MIDWGPFDHLARLLEAAAPPESAFPWAVPVGRGVWQAYLCAPDPEAETLWPPGLVAPRVVATPPVKVRPCWQFWRRRPRERPRPNPGTRREVGEALVACYGWLAGRALQRVLPAWAPFLSQDELPSDLGIVSERAVAWTLYARALDVGGPAALPAAKDVPAPGACLTPGDGLCLNLWVEELVQGLPAQLGLPVPAQAIVPGGLRREECVQGFLALRGAGSPQAAAWLAALGRLVAASPLTQLVYGDVIGDVIEGVCAPPVYAALVAPAGCDWWHDLWYSVLARSLLGALASPPCGHAAWVVAGGQLARLEAAPPINRRQHADLARGYWDLTQKRWTEYQARLLRLGALFRSPETQQGKPGPLAYLHVRLLDMLVRRVVSEAVPDLQKMRQQRLSQGALPSASGLLEPEAGPAFTALGRLLCGEPLTQFVTCSSESDPRAALEALVTLLDRPAGLDSAHLVETQHLPEAKAFKIVSEKLAEVGHVPEFWAGKLLARFSQEPLPLAEPAQPGLAPARLLADSWLPLVLQHRNQLPGKVTTN